MYFQADFMKTKRYRIALYTDYFDSEYIRKIQKGALQFADENGIELVSFAAGELGDTSSNYNYQHMAVAAHLTKQNVDGIIFVSGTQMYYVTPDYLRTYIKSFEPLPVLSVGCAFEDVHSVISDCRKGIQELVTHLITEHHCKRIALMSVGGYSVEGADRTRAFQETLEENGLAFLPSLVMYGSFTYSGAISALTEYYQKKGKIDFDAIVALNDNMAFGCIDFFGKNRILVPEDIIVTGYDDLARSAFTTPSLTTVNQDIEGQGYTAAQMVYRMIRKEKIEMNCHMATNAIFRQSCGCTEKKLDVQQEKTPIAEWFEKSAQFVDTVHLYTELQNDVPLEKLRTQIDDVLSVLDYSAAAICFFKTPVSTDRFEYYTLPPEALLLSAFDKHTKYQLDTSKKAITFDPRKEMLPKGIFPNLNGMIVIALYRNSIQYGYIVFRPGHYDMVVYNMACKILSSTLASSYNITCAEREKKELEKEYTIANRISLTDEMTGLLNRRGIISLGQKTLEVAEAISQSGVVIYGDMDGLKKINDTYGHAAGDRAIKAESKLLKKQFLGLDIIGRLGGDEFALIAPDMSEREFLSIKKKLYAECTAWNKTSKEKFTLSISLGFASFTPEMKKYNINKLLEVADKSLYQEKERKKSHSRTRSRKNGN